MADTHAWWHHPEAAKGLLGPTKEAVALVVALVFPLQVGPVGRLTAVGVHLDRVIDDQVGVHQRVNPLGVAAAASHRRSHRGQVHHGEVLEQDPGGEVGQLALLVRFRYLAVPIGQEDGVLGCRVVAARLAQQHLQPDLDGAGEPVGVTQPLVPESGQTEETWSPGA